MRLATGVRAREEGAQRTGGGELIEMMVSALFEGRGDGLQSLGKHLGERQRQLDRDSMPRKDERRQEAIQAHRATKAGTPDRGTRERPLEGGAQSAPA